MEPDRIQGLQRTANFETLLRTPYAHDYPNEPDKLVEDVVKSSVNPLSGGDPLLFPFLVHEAKSAKSCQDFKYRETQSAFPIKNALELQSKFRDTRQHNRYPWWTVGVVSRQPGRSLACLCGIRSRRERRAKIRKVFR